MNPGDDAAAVAAQPALSAREGAFMAGAQASLRERRIALGVVLLCAAILAAAAPFGHLRLPAAPAFVVAHETGMAIVQLVTAAVLLSQARQLGSSPVAVLASGYLFAACLTVPHLLAFSGVVPLDSAARGAPWLAVLWHGGFILWVIAYGLSGARPGRSLRATLAFPALALLAACLCVLLALYGAEVLPPLVDGGRYTPFGRRFVGPVVLLLCFSALGTTWRRSRLRSVLDLWLAVVMFLGLLEIGLTAAVGAQRYDLGFYVARAFGLASASFVLVAFLFDADRLQRRLAEALALSEARNAALERSQTQLARAQRLEAVGQLTGGIAHDFNNLLTVVIGTLELIQHSPGNVERVRRLAATATSAAERGARLTHQLLTFARRQVSRPETVNLNRLVADLEPLLRRAAGAGVALETVLNPLLDPAWVDPSQFEAAVLNLVVNARDAITGAGHIAIETANVSLPPPEASGGPASNRYVRVSVRDTGAGMPEEVRAHAFEPFFTTKDVGKGSGLGLSQVYGFVQSAGGHVEIDSTPGAGTTVSLYLPRSAERLGPADLPAGAADGEGAAPAGTGHGAILVVEDDPAVQSYAVEELSALGYEVCAASDAREALDILRGGGRLDLLFSDIVMPGGMNGAELAAEARRLRPGLKVLLTSGYAAGALSTEHGLSDHLDVLGKPYRRDDLAARLRAVLGGAATRP